VTASLGDRAGGLATTVPAGVNAVARRGIEAHVFGLWERGLDPARLPYERATVHAVPYWPTPLLRLAPALDRALTRIEPDVLHLQGLWLYPSIAALRWRGRTGRPLVISPHGMLDAWALQNSAWKKRLALALFERHNLSGAACLHALAAGELGAFRAMGLYAPVAIIPNGVDLPTSTPHPSRPSWLEGEARRILLFLGRIHPKKGIAEALRAWALALHGSPEMRRHWVFVIAGWDDGGHTEGLRRLSAQLGVGPSVRFTGPVFGPEKDALLQAADAFILPSHSEGLPMAVLEAWSHGCPVLMTRACNLPEGFAARAAVEITTDPAAMAPVLATSLADPNFPAFGAAGRALVAERFTWDRVGRDLADVYGWLSGRGPRPGCVVTD
jgi:glycosyltransferase involved in cell wall biosynthesis